MTVLNCWLVTREMEASAATWLLPASKRHPHAAGEVRTHDCGCADEVRHSLCPFFVQYFALLAARFGPGFDTVQSNLPLFPARNGDMLLKHQIITANRSVIAMSGTAPTMIDGIGNTRQRVGGHVCRVVGAVWLHQNLTDLHFVQLFSRWGRRLSRGTSQTLRCTNKQILQHLPVIKQSSEKRWRSGLLLWKTRWVTKPPVIAT